jgi:cytoskeletal protein CcmA (bactofilin family)
LAIFGKDDAPLAPPASGPRAPADSPASATLIGAKARLTGEIVCEEDLAIHGRVDGKVRGGRKVTIAAGGEVVGEVHAKSAMLAGRLKGLLEATERAELAATAVLEGDVHAPKIVIAEGAVIQGKIDMSGGGRKAAPPSQEAAG